jgi:mannose-6-phosphate isomerase-like protein (cupin superfamily)
MKTLNKLSGRITPKGWGYELEIINSELYCSKVLHFQANKKGSFHFHLNKTETWFISSGKFLVSTTNPETGQLYNYELNPGDILHIPNGVCHQVVCLAEGDIYETSTKHSDDDTYRLAGGDSQK